MAWLQFFDADDEVFKEFRITPQAQVGLTPDGGMLVQDPGGIDSKDNPRILVVSGNVLWTYAKTISDQLHDKAEPGDGPAGIVLGQ